MTEYQIAVGNVGSQLSGYTAELESYLAIEHENFWFSPRYRMGLWDGKTHFLKVPSLRFPTGLLFLVEDFFNTHSMPYKIIDARNKPQDPIGEIRADMLGGITLRDYQVLAIEAAIRKGRGVLELPTGSGKTEIAAGIIKAIPSKALFLVHTQDLLHQTAKRFEKRIGEKIGLIGDGIFQPEPRIVVATVQSLNSKWEREQVWCKNFLDAFYILFQDETHHSSAATWYKLGSYTHRAYYRFGLSGTILRKDILSNVKMLALFGAPIMKIGTRSLIDQGFLSEIEVRMINNDEKISGGTWQSIYEKAIVLSDYRNSLVAMIAEEEYNAGRKIMILVRRLEHGKILAERLAALNIPAHFLHGSDSSEEREETKELFSDKEAERFVLIASSIFDEGVDIPEINTLIIAAGGASEVKTIQTVGRGLRPKEGGGSLVVYDFADSSDYISKHSKKRKAIYEQEMFNCISI